MSITLHIPPELEDQLSAEALRRNQPVEEVALSVIAESLAIGDDANQRSADQWRQELQDWIESHRPVSHFVDDSRASVYADER
jgi:hypothetical protein